MDIVFDTAQIERNRLRALKNGDPRARFLMALAAEEFADRLSIIERHFARAAELFGGTGEVARNVLQSGKIGALKRIETHASMLLDDIDAVVSAYESVPLAPQSLNLILSPLSLHLINDLPGNLIQMRRALLPDGLFLAAIPGSGTLQELRDVLLAAEVETSGGASPRIAPLADVRDIGALLQRAGFALPVTDVESYTVRYDSIFPLMQDLRAMGMSNPLMDRSRKPMSRTTLLRAAELYQQRYSDPDGRIRATFNIIYASGWAPHENQQKPLKPGSAKMRLADALKITSE
jgi:SAM-dependent methyltransferase